MFTPPEAEEDGPAGRPGVTPADRVPLPKADGVVRHVADLVEADAGLLPEAELLGGPGRVAGGLLQVGVDRVPGVARRPVIDELLQGPVVDLRQEADQALPQVALELPNLLAPWGSLGGEEGEVVLDHVRALEAGVDGAGPARGGGGAEVVFEVGQHLLDTLDGPLDALGRSRGRDPGRAATPLL